MWVLTFHLIGGGGGALNKFQLVSLWELKDRGLSSLRKGLNLCRTGHILVWSAKNWCNDSLQASGANVYINYNLFRSVEKIFQRQVNFLSIRDILYPFAVLRGSLHSCFVSTAHGVTLTTGYYEVNTNICSKPWLSGCLAYLAVYVRLFTAEWRWENQLVIYHASKRMHTGGSSGLKHI